MKKLSKIAILFFIIFILPQSVDATRLLIPVGQVIGMELADGSVTVAGTTGESPLKSGDRILSIDSRRITCAADIRKALMQSDGTVTVTVLRNGKEKQLRIAPTATADGPRLGVYLKEGITGIGTVTYYDPNTGDYGALGHGVSDRSGTLLQMKEGTSYEASVLSVKKGKIGTPGQLLGSLRSNAPVGKLDKNTSQGVFGNCKNRWQGQVLPTAAPEEVREGSATIRCAVTGNEVQEYSVEILKIYPCMKGKDRNLLLKVTDPVLLETTGGIVQGMSGSPIIQDGKLVGAVTHVLVNDPTTGYGIFIENMLDAAA